MESLGNTLYKKLYILYAKKIQEFCRQGGRRHLPPVSVRAMPRYLSKTFMLNGFKYLRQSNGPLISIIIDTFEQQQLGDFKHFQLDFSICFNWSVMELFCMHF